MIAKASWFSQRKFGGWGLSPNCWQGWAYIALIALPIILIQYLNLPGFTGTALMLAWSLFFSIDFLMVFFHIKKDERDILHEALAERNAMWFMIMALIVGVAYQTASSGVVDPVILVALIGAMIVKAITHFYLRNR